MFEQDNTPKKVTVLGLTFNSEEERRQYFRDELRTKLPELKLMEGFPIGEDEDIINLSDPPFYTACPNPWLNDFITEWEVEKEQLEKEGKRTSNLVVDEPYTADISEGKNNPIYNAHTYHTKVPHPAIMRYILKYTQPGDIVFDGFAGTGMTGVACSQLSKPTSDYKFKIESEDHTVKWGKRHGIVADLSPIASFIASNYNKKIEFERFEEEATTLLDKIEKEYSWMFETLHSDGITKGKVKYFVWSDIYLCKNCGAEVNFYKSAVDPISGKVSELIECESCGNRAPKRKYDKLFNSYYDPIIGETQREIKRELVLIKYWIGKKTFEKSPDDFDFKILKKVEELEIINLPTTKISKGDKTGEPIRLGINYSHQMFFKRILVIVHELFKSSKSNELKLLVNSQITNLSKQNRYRPGVSFPFNPLNGTLYIGAQISEANPFWAFNNKVKKFCSAFYLTDTNLVSTSSATQTNLNNESVDYIFTDPPFGLNLMYSELNFFMESWLKVLTNSEKEAIENKTQHKDKIAYNRLMELSFKEFFRVLKPNKWMTVEFSNTSASIWNGIQLAIQNSGFIIANVTGIDKKQRSFNAVNSVTAVKQDLVISCYKPSSVFDQKFKQNQNTDVAIWDFVVEHLQHLPIHLKKENSTTAIIERSPKILFDRLIAFYVQKGLPVPIDAGKFQQGLHERYIERDGMFFTNEQVQVYDKKKEEHPNLIQYSLFVSSEQDGVLWLKNYLKNKPSTYQDIRPDWMQAIGGVRKGDVIPEMETILEENFLKDDAGKWYLPDPENEADLEKLRNKRLVKQFETYKAEALKPKGKIKEVRVEALRAGFKQCYQDKDFQTIVRVGDRIPNNLLMEDEVLLQFYDIAASRV